MLQLLPVGGDGKGGYLNRGRVAAGGVGQFIQRRPAGLYLFHRRPGRQPAVGPAHDPAEHILGIAAQEYRRMRLLYRLGIAFDRRKVEVLAVKLGFPLRPQLFHHQDGFPGLRPAVVKIAAHNFRFLAQPAGPHAQDKPPAGVQIQGGYDLGGQQGIAFRDQGNAGAQLEGASNGGGPGQGHIGIDQVGHILRNGAVRRAVIAAAALHRHYGMFRQPQGLKAHRLRLPRQIRHIQRLAGQGHKNAHFHKFSASACLGFIPLTLNWFQDHPEI